MDQVNASASLVLAGSSFFDGGLGGLCLLGILVASVGTVWATREMSKI